MKLKSIVFFSLAMLAAAISPQAALADSLSFTLAHPTQSVTSTGGTLSYTGTITAASTNTGFEYLNSDNITLAGTGTFDDTGYFNGPAFLTAGQSYTGLLFTVTYQNGAMAGTYPGSFSILGGANDSTYNTLATADFQANVTAPPAAITPEPSSLALLGTGALFVVGVMRRRLQS